MVKVIRINRVDLCGLKKSNTSNTQMESSSFSTQTNNKKGSLDGNIQIHSFNNLLQSKCTPASGDIFNYSIFHRASIFQQKTWKKLIDISRIPPLTHINKVHLSETRQLHSHEKQNRRHHRKRGAFAWWKCCCCCLWCTLLLGIALASIIVAVIDKKPTTDVKITTTIETTSTRSTLITTTTSTTSLFTSSRTSTSVSTTSSTRTSTSVSTASSTRTSTSVSTTSSTRTSTSVSTTSSTRTSTSVSTTSSTRTSTSVSTTSVSSTTTTSSAFISRLNENLLINGDGETGPCEAKRNITHPSVWNYNGSVTQTYYTNPSFGSMTPTSPGPNDRGNCFFFGYSSTVTTMWQTVNLTDVIDPMLIDNQTIRFNLSAWLGGWQYQDDNARVILNFYDQNDQAVGSSTTIGPVLASDRGSITKLLPRQANGYVPIGSRSFKVTVIFTCISPADNDGIADNIAVALFI